MKGLDIMAEKYGVIPPKFTKAWWSYFWEYYKWYVIGIGFAVIALGTTAVQCVTREKYDLNVTYSGKAVFAEEDMQKVEDVFSPLAADVDGNNKSSVLFQAFSINGQPENAEFEFAMQTKLDLEMQSDCSFIYIFGEDEFNRVMNRSFTEDSFVPVSEWGFDVNPNAELKSDQNGISYGVDVSGVFKDLGLNTDKAYVVLKKNFKDDELNAAGFDASLKLLKEITR